MTAINIPEKQTPTKHHVHTAEERDVYDIGDCYGPSPLAQEWEIQDTSKMPYLRHVKSLANSWKTLQYLVHFMEVGTTPLRWKSMKENPADREERLNRVKVTMVDYVPGVQAVPKKIESPSGLREALQTDPTDKPSTGSLRLFLVEDLSRQVIEQLGSRYDIDPLFFREHIVDYVWFNTRDPYVVPPPLLASMKHQKWFRLRHSSLRYYVSNESFENACNEANEHNVYRRPDNDRNHWLFIDAPGSTVSITRQRTTIWVGPDKANPTCKVGIVLIDPSIRRDGYPLWFGHTNWLPTPSSDLSDPIRPLLGPSLFDTILNATMTYPWFQPPSDSVLDQQILVKPAIYTICAEWQIITDYIKARLAQVEWELEKPAVFRSMGDTIERSLNRLHTWRRVVPLLREMVAEIQEQALPAAARLTGSKDGSTLDDMVPDFERLLRKIDDLQERVDRQSGAVMGEISWKDSRQGLEENHSLARLTWLATIFIPLSFVTGLFSMTDDLSSMSATFGWYFLAAVPLTLVCMLVAARVGKNFKADREKKRVVEAMEKDDVSTKSRRKRWDSFIMATKGKKKAG